MPTLDERLVTYGHELDRVSGPIDLDAVLRGDALAGDALLELVGADPSGPSVRRRRLLAGALAAAAALVVITGLFVTRQPTSGPVAITEPGASPTTGAAPPTETGGTTPTPIDPSAFTKPVPLLDHTGPDGSHVSVRTGEVPAQPAGCPCWHDRAAVQFTVTPAGGGASRTTTETLPWAETGPINVSIDTVADGPQLLALRTNGGVARVRAQLPDGRWDDEVPTQGWAAFASAHGWTRLEASDAAGHVLVSCVPGSDPRTCG
jgi:hypothetical protein